MRWKLPRRAKSDAHRIYRSGVTESLRLYLAIVSREWLALLGAATALLAIVLALLNEQVSAVALGVIAVACLFVAQFIAFHREREKGSELGGALYLYDISWALVRRGESATLQPTLHFRNTSARQMFYELVDYSLTVNEIVGQAAFANESGWIGAGQDAHFRLPPVGNLPILDSYSGVFSYGFIYSSPRVTHYEHHTSRSVEFTASRAPQGEFSFSVLWTYQGSGQEETIRR